MPPAPMAPSCWSSPTRHTLPPCRRVWPMTVSRVGVSAIPASSMSSKVRGPISPAQSGNGWWWSSPQVSRGRRRGGQAQDVSATGGPHVREHLEGGGLACPGGGEHQLDPATVRRHRPHHLL